MIIISGFKKDFLGLNKEIAYPSMEEGLKFDALNYGQVYDFTHFSLVMNRKLKSAIYVAYNIDKKSERAVRRNNYWHYDEHIGEENQIGNKFYKNNPWDRGHLARRKSLCWGSKKEAIKANYDSFCWANITLQHKDINQGNWGQLEEWVYEKLSLESSNNKLSVFTGPIYGIDSIEYCGSNTFLGCGVFIPSGFFKVICYVDKNDKLSTISFIIRQQKYLNIGILSLTENLKVYEVSIKKIMEETKIIFPENIVKSDVYSTTLSTKETIDRPKLILTMNDIDL